MPGILMSRNTRSGGSRSTAASALGPDGPPHELVALVLEDHPQRVADGRLVVDDQDAGGHSGDASTRTARNTRWPRSGR